MIFGAFAKYMAAALSTGGIVPTPTRTRLRVRLSGSGELAVYVGNFAHSYGHTRHTRGPAAELSHNHADPAFGTNDGGETTFSPPTTIRPSGHRPRSINSPFPSRFRHM